MQKIRLNHKEKIFVYIGMDVFSVHNEYVNKLAFRYKRTTSLA